MDPIPGFAALLAHAEDRAATDALLAVIRPWIEQQARKHADADENVSDLVQEAWLRAWRKLDQFTGADDEAQAQSMFRAWLARIVSRLGLNAARDRAARGRVPPGKLLQLNGVGVSGDSAMMPDPSTGQPTPSAQVQADEHARKVREALNRIDDPLDRDIIRLRFFEGLSLREVAEQVGFSHETVRQRYHAALSRLQRDLGGME